MNSNGASGGITGWLPLKFPGLATGGNFCPAFWLYWKVHSSQASLPTDGPGITLFRSNAMNQLVMGLEASVLKRYGNAAREVESCLCLPVSYNQDLLKVIPQEILEKDYGCGDPSRHIGAGETVLDLGSGSGKACYIMAQIVGAKGKIIGVDFNPPMLELARKYQKAIGDQLGYYNVEFRHGKIQDLKTNLELVDGY